MGIAQIATPAPITAAITPPRKADPNPPRFSITGWGEVLAFAVSLFGGVLSVVVALLVVAALAGFAACALSSDAPLAVDFFGSASGFALVVAGVEVVSAFAVAESDFGAASAFAGVSALVAGVEVGLAVPVVLLDVSALVAGVDVEDDFAGVLDFDAAAGLLDPAALDLSVASGVVGAFVSFGVVCEEVASDLVSDSVVDFASSGLLVSEDFPVVRFAIV
ncbi:hypothetical protein [Thioclava sp. JE_KL1]|uniref:hypothetical protein n=1 Tax=Thioclava sp. JE_KL1 TaxID=2651187 RepID=UPI00128D6B05|nr:hypothetical protein [Thioclava sp. JE_KL1]MPQ94240.1 hypothetical protein [Thioclava sp. JE_KL1]